MHGISAMNLSWALVPLFAAALLGPVASCSTKDNASSNQTASFPYAGPSCAAADSFYGDACWQCSQSECSSDCETTDCAAYFHCYCACQPGGPSIDDSGLNTDNACQAGCDGQMTPACQQCRSALGQCQGQHCEPACGFRDAG